MHPFLLPQDVWEVPPYVPQVFVGAPQLPDLPQWIGPLRDDTWKHPLVPNTAWRLAFDNHWEWQYLTRRSTAWRSAFFWWPPYGWVVEPGLLAETQGAANNLPSPPIEPPQLAAPPQRSLSAAIYAPFLNQNVIDPNQVPRVPWPIRWGG